MSQPEFQVRSFTLTIDWVDKVFTLDLPGNLTMRLLLLNSSGDVERFVMINNDQNVDLKLQRWKTVLVYTKE